MSTTGTEKHCRLCLMLMKGGTKASHRLLLKRVEDLSPTDHQPFPWTIDDFLQSKTTDIKKSNLAKEKIRLLLPGTGSTDLRKWDLSLFCYILTMFCQLEQLTRLDVARLRTLRNELCHVNEPSVDDVKYRDFSKAIKISIGRILDETGDQDVKEEVRKIIDGIDSEPLSLADALKGMHVFYSMDRIIEEKLEHLQDGNESILQRMEKVEEHVSTISSKLQPEARNNICIPGLNFFVDLKNLSQECEDNISTLLVELFEEVIAGEEDLMSRFPRENYLQLRDAVRKTFKAFLSKGWRITGARRECVHLYIECKTFASLASLFREYVNGNINKQLNELKKAISSIEDYVNIELETVIYKDEFWKVIDKTVSSVEDILSECNKIDPALIENLQLHDIDTAWKLSFSARRASIDEKHAVERKSGSDLETCLKLIETEIGKQFNVPYVSVQTSYTVQQNLIKTAKSTESQKENEADDKYGNLPGLNTATMASTSKSYVLPEKHCPKPMVL